MEETLFGVVKGHLVGCELRWRQQPDGNDQQVFMDLLWESRKPTHLVVLVPDDQQISHYVALFMPILMNGPWMHKQRLDALVKKVFDKCVTDGAEVRSYGTRVPGI